MSDSEKLTAQRWKTVGRDERVIRRYGENHEAADHQQDQLKFS